MVSDNKKKSLSFIEHIHQPLQNNDHDELRANEPMGSKSEDYSMYSRNRRNNNEYVQPDVKIVSVL